MSDIQNHINETASILIVDDNMNNLQVLGSILHENHYNVVIARDGESALKNAAKKAPDIILLDIMMPEMDGYEVCSKLREMEETRFTPVIFLSAKQETDSIVKGFNVGGNDYITKPFVKDELLARIRNQLFIAQSSKNLKEMLKAKDHFFQVVAHDLKTPVNNQMNFADLLQSNIENYDTDKVKSFVKMIYDTAVGQYKLLENLLEWTRLQTGVFAPDMNTFKLYEIVDQNIKLHNSALSHKNLSIGFEGDDSLTVNADMKMIDTAVRNLLSNAIKFSNDDGKITIKVNATDETIELSVIDTGIGISKDDQESLFSLQGTGRTKIGDSEAKGTGLGLLLSKEFIELNGGNISVESALGAGATFTIQLPNKN